MRSADSIETVIFQDGRLYLDPEGPVRAGIVLDNLVAGNLIPPTVGIFVDPGVDPFPELISRHPANDVRVFMQTAQRDLNWGQSADNWFAENLRVAAALDEAGHDLRLVVGSGGHSPNHGGVLLPDDLRWMLNGAGESHAAGDVD